MKQRNVNNTILRYLLFAIFIGYLGSVSLFPHVHVENGIKIVHSHPYKSGQDEGPGRHTHNGNSFILIQFLSQILAVTAVVFIATKVLKIELVTIFPERTARHFKNHKRFSLYFPRGPGL